jgi:hypothetical protein
MMYYAAYYDAAGSFHGERVAAYPTALQERIQQFLDGGWQFAPIPTEPPH